MSKLNLIFVLMGSAYLAASAWAQTTVAHWSFDEGYGTTAADSSASNRTASLVGSATWTAMPPTNVASPVPVGPYGLSLGSSSYAQAAGAAVDTSSNFTASCWVKLNSTSGFQTLLSIDGNNLSGFFLQLQGNGRFGFRKHGSDSTAATAYYAECPVPASAGVWYHLTGVFSNTANRLLLYTNGALAANVVYSGTVWSGAGNTAIGRGKYNGGNVDFVNGQIDDVRLYQSALSAGQIQSLYAQGFAPQFTLTPMPMSVIAPQGGTGVSTLTIGKLNGFTGAVTLSAGNLPPDVTASFIPQPATNNSVLSLTVSNSVPIGHYNFTVVGTSNSVVRSTPMLLMVTSNSVAVNYVWPSYSPDLNYNFTNEFTATSPPTNILNDCSGVTDTITLSNNWFC